MWRTSTTLQTFWGCCQSTEHSQRQTRSWKHCSLHRLCSFNRHQYRNQYRIRSLRWPRVKQTTQATSHYPVIIIQYAKIQPQELQTTASYTFFYLEYTIIYLFIYCLLCERTSICLFIVWKKILLENKLILLPIHLWWHHRYNTVRGTVTQIK